MITLQLHLEHKQFIMFNYSDDISNAIHNDFVLTSMLIEYFHMNKINKKARTLLYRQFPKYFVWNNKDKFWYPRKKKVMLLEELLQLIQQKEKATIYDYS